MTVRRSALKWGLFAGLALFGASGAMGAAAVAQEGPLHIGFPAGLTGEVAALDGPLVEGAKLKAAEINASGGVLGRQIVLDIQDTKGDLKRVKAVGVQLVLKGKVPVLMGYSDSDPALVLGAVAEKAGIPYVTPGATSPKLPRQVGRTIFLACFGDNAQAAAGAEFMLGKLEAKTAFVIWDTAPAYTRLLAGYFRTAYRHDGGRIVGQATYKGGKRDLTTALARLKKLHEPPAAIYLAAMPDDVGQVVQALRAAGFAGPIVGGDGYDTPDLIKTAGPAADGIYYSTHAYMSDDGTAPVRAFFEAFRKAYGKAPENAFAALGYDTVALIADAIKRAGAATPAKIRAALETTRDFHGVTGTLSYLGRSHVPAKTVWMLGVKGGKLYLANESIPRWIPKP